MISGEQWLLILSMAAILYLTRIVGLVIVDRLPDSPRLARVLDVLPGITMVAIVLPAVAASGTIGIIASLLVWAVVARTGSLALSMVLGVVVVAVFG
jgi:uncharacterized membrane protein